MVDINWDEAPEGATHIVRPVVDRRNPWRKVDVANDKVYAWHTKEQGGLEGEWVDRRVESADNYLRINKGLLIERPVVVEVELPEGRVWREDYTHCNTTYKFFFKEGQAVMDVEEDPFHLPEPNYTFWIRHQGTITRFPGAKPKAPVEQPVKRKPVGWWN